MIDTRVGKSASELRPEKDKANKRDKDEPAQMDRGEAAQGGKGAM